MSSPCTRRCRWLLPTAISLVIFGFSAPGPVLAECLVSTVYCIGKDCCPGDVIFHEFQTSADPARNVLFGTSSASYNLVSGTLTAVAFVAEAWEHRSGATAVDVFTMTGVSAATIKVRLALTWATVVDPSGKTSWTSGYARLEALGQAVEANSLGPHIDPNIELVIDVTGGVPFSVTYEVAAGGWAQYPMASMTAHLHFIDLPEDAEITSCNGYGGTLVPVEDATWGRIKSLFR